MARPHKTTSAKHSRRLIVRVTDADLARVHANAQKAGLLVSEYVRRIAVDGKIVIKQESGYGMSMAFQLKRIGVNLNQLMPLAHLDGEVPPELPSLLEKIETLLDRIIRNDRSQEQP